ncbi:STAS domain-containing protein [Aerosticca soli]|jgi:ABC-type transporter Mla MlaB component|nr:STAS domain-containing protein [Aerosticca soli]MDI3262121.1 STAS domain-containing protein [Fulvimonas sp.]
MGDERMVARQHVEGTVREAVVIGLPADCRMAALGPLLRELVQALDAPATVLDGRAVERVDTAALQLLLLFRREAAARRHAVRWLGASQVLRDAAGVLGLAQALDLPADSRPDRSEQDKQ